MAIYAASLIELFLQSATQHSIGEAGHTDITLVQAEGRGSTELSAFDTALYQAGVGDFNLLVLSSVIPPGSRIVRRDRYASSEGQCGDRLFVVKAEMRSSEPGLWLGAAIGWYQFEDGRGVFVEHELAAERQIDAQTALETMVRGSLRDACRNRSREFSETDLSAVINTCCVEDEPTSALVLAVYQSMPWS